MMATNLKDQVRNFWDAESCGETYAVGESDREYYETHRQARYQLEPYIPEFAKFHEGRDKDVLEVGVGMGADHKEWAASAPRALTGIDLTPAGIEHTAKRLAVYGLESGLRVGDAEKLPFDDNSFDIVYSWGVLHHTPDTPGAINEVHRVLRPGGIARIMVYHTHSLVGYMLWARYGLMRGRPFRSLADIYAEHLESPGTKAYSVDEAREMCNRFSECDVWTQLSFGDLLQGDVGQRHRGALLTAAKGLWPRWLIKRIFRSRGLCLLIKATK